MPGTSVTQRIVDHLTAEVGGAPQRATVTFLGVEPIDVLRFADAAAGHLVFATVGCARHPMHDPSDLAPDPVRGPRAELVVRMVAAGPLPGLHKTLATVAAAPAVEGLVLAADSLIDLQEPLWHGARCSAFLMTDDALGDLELDEPADPVHFLRAVPITANEAAWVRLKGADALREAWAEAGIDVADPARSPATPD
ncbi:MAG: suppressor of fused domain protein [Gordonia sp. (in: high G+C Gram-positive bacteria)]